MKNTRRIAYSDINRRWNNQWKKVIDDQYTEHSNAIMTWLTNCCETAKKRRDKSRLTSAQGSWLRLRAASVTTSVSLLIPFERTCCTCIHLSKWYQIRELHCFSIFLRISNNCGLGLDFLSFKLIVFWFLDSLFALILSFIIVKDSRI